MTSKMAEAVFGPFSHTECEVLIEFLYQQLIYRTKEENKERNYGARYWTILQTFLKHA